MGDEPVSVVCGERMGRRRDCVPSLWDLAFESCVDGGVLYCKFKSAVVRARIG